MRLQGLVLASVCVLSLLLSGAVATVRQAPERVSGEARLDVRGNFCNLRDAAGRVVYTPALPAAPDETFREWMRLQREAGSTHVFFGPPAGGPAYPGVPWSNPDFWAHLPSLRAFIEKVLSTPAADGKGFRPVLFVGANTFADSHVDQWADLASTLGDLDQFLIIVPAWEPVDGGWTPSQLSAALIRLHQLLPSAAIAWHGSPGRWSGASHPPAPGDPWRGSDAAFYDSAGGEWVQLVFYQTPHGLSFDRPCDSAEAACWLNGWLNGVHRLGLRRDGDRPLRIVLFETVAYDFYRGHATSADARRAATSAQAICAQAHVTCGFGNGLPE